MVASLLTLRSGMKFLDSDGTVALQIVVKAHLSVDLATVACISSHVRPAPLHELYPQACTKLLVREKLGFIVLTILEIRVADVNTFRIPFLSVCRVPRSHLFTSSSNFASDNAMKYRSHAITVPACTRPYASSPKGMCKKSSQCREHRWILRVHRRRSPRAIFRICCKFTTE
jgi:hypothetical protein